MEDGTYRSFEDLPPSTVSCVIFFGSIIFTTVAMAAKTWIMGDPRAIREALVATSTAGQARPNIVPLKQDFQSIYVLLHHFSILGLIIFFVYTCEHHAPFFHRVERQDFDADTFVFLCIIVVMVGIFSIQKNDRWMLTKYGPGRFSDNGFLVDEEKNMKAGSSTMSKNSSVEDMQKENRRSSNASIKSDELVSLLEKDSPLLKAVNEEECDEGGAGDEKDLDDEDDVVLEDIVVGDEVTKALETKELMEYHMIGVPTISPEPDDDIFNIHQTLELKGLITCCFLIYQSTNAGVAHEIHQTGSLSNPDLDEGRKLNEYYNLSRVASTAFLFMSGFGHTMYFHRMGDYTMRRLITVMFRLNMGAMFLCLALDKPYIFYKPCAIHTYFFLHIYATMRWRRSKNYTKFGLRMKIILVAISIYIAWDLDLGAFAFHTVIFGRSHRSISGAPYGQLWEFYFQSYMHHWAALAGMLYAVNHPVTSLTMRRLEKFGNPTEMLFKGIIGGAISVAMILWLLGPLRMSKYMFNATNAYFGILPVLWYVFVRNLSERGRTLHSDTLKMIGKLSLEVYLLHHHIFLTDESDKKLVVLPGYPACNLIFITVLLLVLSKLLKTSTTVLIAMLTRKSNDDAAVWRAVTVVGSITILHAISVTLSYMRMSTPEMVGTATLVCGILLYQATMDMTLSGVTSKHSHKKGLKTSRLENPLVKSSPPVFGAIAVICLCAVWHSASMKASVNALMPLPPACANAVNEGLWTEVDPCTEFQKGIDAREYKSRSTSKSCAKTTQWGWTENAYSETCKFKFLNPAEAQRKLPNKNIIFIGDTVTRSLFFAFCRGLGDANSGDFDSDAPVHSELKKSFGDTHVMFQWAPLTNDVLHKMKAVNVDTDLVIAGSGILDKLHLWATDEKKASYELTVKQLAKDLKFLKENSAPVVWVTPTTINTPALQSQEKRTQISEKNIQEIRNMYVEFEINDSATFVLDGPGFTRDQVGRSYDGIHYPQEVYDVGAQILMNALDWLIRVPKMSTTKLLNPTFDPRPGSMANPILGLMTLCCILIGLFFFDGYLGFSYLASVFMQPMTVPVANRVALFYTSKEEQSRYSFMPQDIHSDICRAYARPRRQKNKANFQSHTEEVAQQQRSKNSRSGYDTSSSNNPSSGMSMSSRRSTTTFGLATITEDSQSTTS